LTLPTVRCYTRYTPTAWSIKVWFTYDHLSHKIDDNTRNGVATVTKTTELLNGIRRGAITRTRINVTTPGSCRFVRRKPLPVGCVLQYKYICMYVCVCINYIKCGGMTTRVVQDVSVKNNACWMSFVVVADVCHVFKSHNL